MDAQLSLPGIGPPPLAIDRLFFALLPEKKTAMRILDRARSAHREARSRGRLIDARKLHVSLPHLGNHFALSLEWLDAARRAASRIETQATVIHFDRALTLAGRGKSSRARPFVLASSNDRPVRDLYAALCDSMRRQGLPVQSRHCVPHVTMFYDERDLGERAIEPIALRVAEFVIVHNRVGTGMPYDVLGRWALKAQR